MESDWEKFRDNLNQSIDAKLAPIEQEISNQDEMIKKLAQSLSKVSEAVQSKYGKFESGKGLKKSQEGTTLKSNREDKEEPKEELKADS